MYARAIDYIYLRPSYTTTGNYAFYNINTKHIISHRHCTSIPTPTHIINTIEYHEKQDNISSGINFHSNKIQNNNLLFAVVDDEQEDDESNNQQEYQNNEYDNKDYNNMDINETKDILYEPSIFNIPHIVPKKT